MVRQFKGQYFDLFMVAKLLFQPDGRFLRLQKLFVFIDGSQIPLSKISMVRQCEGKHLGLFTVAKLLFQPDGCLFPQNAKIVCIH